MISGLKHLLDHFQENSLLWYILHVSFIYLLGFCFLCPSYNRESCCVSKSSFQATPLIHFPSAWYFPTASYLYHSSYVDPIFISSLQGSTSHAFLNPDKLDLLLSTLPRKSVIRGISQERRMLPIFNKCISFHLSFALSL